MNHLVFEDFLPEMAMHRSDALQDIKDGAGQINYHLSKVIGTDASLSTKRHWLVEITTRYENLGSIKLKSGKFKPGDFSKNLAPTKIEIPRDFLVLLPDDEIIRRINQIHEKFDQMVRDKSYDRDQMKELILSFTE